LLRFGSDLEWRWSAMSDKEFSLAERLEHGNLTVGEVCTLKPRCHSGFYEDVKKGLVVLRKIGRKSVVPGPVARAYIEGRSIAGAAGSVASPKSEKPAGAPASNRLQEFAHIGKRWLASEGTAEWGAADWLLKQEPVYSSLRRPKP
jgi:hypothetical protein